MSRERPNARESKSWVRFIPGLSFVAGLVARVAAIRAGKVPLGLLLLLPVAIMIDVFDFGDEFFFGPVGMAISFAVETAFVLGVSGRPGYAFGFAGIDLIPGVDVIPFATLTVLREFVLAWKHRDDGVIDATARVQPE